MGRQRRGKVGNSYNTVTVYCIRTQVRGGEEKSSQERKRNSQLVEEKGKGEKRKRGRGGGDQPDWG